MIDNKAMLAPTAPQPTPRQSLLERLGQNQEYDLAIVGGGATGLGLALDAAARGFRVVLLEAHDFAKGTSSRATKLVHGGVRYLAQGNIALVREALHERTTLLRNAPHLAQPLSFVMPCYKTWEKPFYGAGLVAYDALAGAAGLGHTRFLSRATTVEQLPGVQTDRLRGGVQYWDGQFNDARLALALARTAANHGALLVNYCPVVGLLHAAGKVVGLECQDAETQQRFTVRAACFVNAAGVWVDHVRTWDGQGTGKAATPIVAPSQGVHLVVDRRFLPSDHALLVPKTADGRVLFAVPWLGKTILGTTDTPRDDSPLEPDALKQEVDFILDEAGRYLQHAPKRADVKSMWVGLRPLVRPQADDGENTKKLSREHTVLVSQGGLVTVTGGKWTTYRAMAEDVMEHCFDRGLLSRGAACATVHLPLVGAPAQGDAVVPIHDTLGWHSYGSEADFVRTLPGADKELAPGLTEAMVRFAARYEYARCVEDVLARRHRLLFLDAQQAAAVAPAVAAVLGEELGMDVQLQGFLVLSEHYQTLP